MGSGNLNLLETLLFINTLVQTHFLNVPTSDFASGGKKVCRITRLGSHLFTTQFAPNIALLFVGFQKAKPLPNN